MPDDRDFYDISEIAAMFKCSRETVKRLCRSGELKSFKFGTKYVYVKKAALNEYIERKCNAGRTEGVRTAADHQGSRRTPARPSKNARTYGKTLS